ncbi:MAG TPA: cell wall hydrolase [Alphaproteobacteria bacterium]|nr:cell wall hydrolase [Alphaproteobacteria bacterium]
MDRPKLIPLPSMKTGNADEKTRQILKDMELDTLARTIWGEARGEGVAGMEAVAMVILNRVAVAQRHGGYWWGNSVIDVCRKAYQFSCWNKQDPNLPRLLSVGKDNLYFVTATRVAQRALLGFLKDQTKGATHYHERSISPKWAVGQHPCAVIGRHLFYKLAEDQ